MNSYVLVILPPRRLWKVINRFREKYAKFTTYIIPPHITICPPFFIKNKSEKEIISLLNDSFLQVRPQKALLNSVDYFEGENNVVFFKPDRKSSRFIKKLLTKSIDSLKDEIKNVYKNYNFTPKKIKPHMIIAEKIPHDILPRIKRELVNTQIALNFKINSVFLYRRKGNLRQWKELKEIHLGKI